MRVLVLGSGAGGGFPQWNCGCSLCAGVRNNRIQALPRTQSSIAITVDDEHWVLINASPDIRQQLTNNSAMWPKHTRHSPISAVVLTDAQIDHVTGLLMLREGLPMPLYCTQPVMQELSETFPLLPVLSHWNEGFQQRTLPERADTAFNIEQAPGLEWRVLPIVSNAPPYSARRDAPKPGDNIALYIKDTASGRSLLYAPGLGKITPLIQTFLEKSDCLLVDGTCWNDHEMQVVGSNKRAREMGHLPQNGEGGMMNVLAQLKNKRKILIHINNTNPILCNDSEEREQLNAFEIEVAYDGMDIEL
jgi:pyrroloquinoline quinone biosynthesis protein B